jgi:MEMO1 family protein
MAQPLPRLRLDLDFMPSPVEERPGLLIRDPFHYSDATLIIPPMLVPCLELFDGENTPNELREALVRMTGDLQVGEIQTHLIETLSDAGFVENETFEDMKETRHQEFRDAPVRLPAHAGGGYPDQLPELKTVMSEWLKPDGIRPPSQGKLVGIAAPHVSPSGGWESYREAYHLLDPDLQDRVFVVLGTSHYGTPGRFGLTRKPFETPFGTTRTETGMVDWLQERAGASIVAEDYCHAVEHSIEFQVVYLQALFGADIKILPILCGSFGRSIYEGGVPEDEDEVKRFLETLGELASREGDRFLWVLGIDMAHMGARYGDRFDALADAGRMLEVAARDKARIDRICAGDAAGFWSEVQENKDDLKWCGSAPLYTFLKAVPGAQADLRRYQQWNIDDDSVVSFAALALTF